MPPSFDTIVITDNSAIGMEMTMTTDLDRRSFVQTGSALTAGAAVTAAIWPGPAAAQTPSPAPSGAKSMKFDVKPMPFDPKKIKGLSEKILVSHYENNYTGAVKRLAAITEQLAGLDYAKAPGFLINGLKREELIATNSMILHEVGAQRGAGSRFRQPRSLACRIRRDGQGRGRRLGLGFAELGAARQAPRQRLGRRPYDDLGRRSSHPRARYV
jgi:Fe-Mn family superoxide dismutase